MPEWSTPCDFVWFTPEHYPDCLNYIKRLAPEECAERDLVFGLHEWENVPIPKQDGRSSAAGNCICREFFGCTFFQPGQVKDGKALIANQVMLEEIKPGLVVGNIIHKVLESEGFLKKAEDHKKHTAQIVEKNIKERGEQAELLEKKASFARFRFLVTAAHFAGIKEPSKINDNELADIHRAALLMNKEIPDYELWMQTLCPKPVQAEPPKDFHAYIAEAKAALIQRKEIVKQHG